MHSVKYMYIISTFIFLDPYGKKTEMSKPQQNKRTHPSGSHKQNMTKQRSIDETNLKVKKTGHPSDSANAKKVRMPNPGQNKSTPSSDSPKQNKAKQRSVDGTRSKKMDHTSDNTKEKKIKQKSDTLPKTLIKEVDNIIQINAAYRGNSHAIVLLLCTIYTFLMWP